jgi:TonB family protein
MFLGRVYPRITAAASARLAALVFCGGLALGFGLAASAQQPQPDAAPQPAPSTAAPDAAAAPNAAPAAQQPAATVPPAPASTPATKENSNSEPPEAGGITEEELRRLLVGKSLYLRSGYLDNSLNFNEHGMLVGHSPQGSYTLSGVEIERVRLTKHKLELEGARYGLHFLGALPYEDPTKAVDRVRITPKKKMLRITVDRESVVKPKKIKEKDRKTGTPARTAPAGPTAAQTASVTAAAAQPAPQPNEPSEADQTKAEIAAAPPAERPADPQSVTTTTSPAHARKLLKDALDKIFAQGFDDRLMAAMPSFWKLYYQAVAAKSDYRPSDSAVLRQNAVDKKARLLSTFEPESNEFAQTNGVAGMALYHVVIGADGKPGEIAVARPIGFGLDENAVEAIRKASFEPAIKDGQPVPVLLDLVVQFRIFSKRTAVAGQPEERNKPPEPQLPGPYSVQHP